jgi:hypothetical protein
MAAASAKPASLSDDELRDRLDATLVECLELHQRLGELRQEMTPALREGWLQISQAQYCVGRSGVSSDSYNLNAPAVTKVVARGDGGSTSGSGTPAPEHRFWALETDLFDAKEDAAAASDGGGGDKGTGALRQRGTGADGGAAGRRPTPTANPVQWFGGAKPPPLELRKAQGRFQLALCSAIQLANVQTAFRAASDEHDALSAEKLRRGL